MTTYLITGGAGSLGRALVNEIQRDSGDNIIRILDNNEHALATMKIPYPSAVRKLHGDIADKDRIRRAVHGAHVVIHCAAMKNLEITENNVSELIKTNVVGTDNVISAAIEAGVSKIMFISSDKAIEPSSIYGASKLIGEHTALNYNQTSDSSDVSIFRSGNFMNSNGNVFETWRNQVKAGLSLTITDTACTRYFINTNTAAQTILNCISNMKGGEIFIPDETIMKEKSIIEMAEEFMKEYSSECGILKELSITTTGLRKGEKLSEKLFNIEEVSKVYNDKKLKCWVIK